jgi:hypothetical protein
MKLLRFLVLGCFVVWLAGCSSPPSSAPPKPADTGAKPGPSKMAPR